MHQSRTLLLYMIACKYFTARVIAILRMSHQLKQIQIHKSVMTIQIIMHTHLKLTQL